MSHNISEHSIQNEFNSLLCSKHLKLLLFIKVVDILFKSLINLIEFYYFYFYMDIL